eukprot:TRINITY_DN3391_c0_g1_i2.p1 TRINITY_DN3391_c0_g1~~TRINITY_DN3391_c0_g1_i2.p1  ORF type:complete len:718 (+),score=143.90 TRINITY_DN3391_c0_g1_i2:108-2261(+)
MPGKGTATILFFAILFFLSSSEAQNICSSGSLFTTCYINKTLQYDTPGTRIQGCGNIVLMKGALIECRIPPPLTTVLANLPALLVNTTAPPCIIEISVAGTITIQGTILAEQIILTGSNVTVSKDGLLDTKGRGYGATRLIVGGDSGSLLELALWPGPVSGEPYVDTSGLLDTLSLTNLLSLVSNLQCTGGSGGGNYGSGGSGDCCGNALKCLLSLRKPSDRNTLITELLSGGDSGSSGGTGGDAALLLPLLCSQAALLRAGGAGGGKITITAATTVLIDGIVSSIGDTVTKRDKTVAGPGGGAGGAILIDATTLLGSGTVTVNGGAGTAPGGGGGGGGFLLVYAPTVSSKLSLLYAGGAGGDCGSVGGLGQYTYNPNRRFSDEETLGDDSLVVSKISRFGPAVDMFINDLASNSSLLSLVEHSDLNDTLEQAYETKDKAIFKFYFGKLSEVDGSYSELPVPKFILPALPLVASKAVDLVGKIFSEILKPTVSGVFRVLNWLVGSSKPEIFTLDVSPSNTTDSRPSIKVSLYLGGWKFNSSQNFLRFRFYAKSFHGIKNVTYDYEDDGSLTAVITNDYDWKLQLNFSKDIFYGLNEGNGTIIFLDPENATEADKDHICPPVDSIEDVIAFSILIPNFNTSATIDPNLGILFGGYGKRSGGGGIGGSNIDDNDAIIIGAVIGGTAFLVLFGIGVVVVGYFLWRYAHPKDTHVEEAVNF